VDPLRRDVVSVPVIIIVQVVICGGVRVFSERSCEVCVPLRMMRFIYKKWKAVVENAWKIISVS
jgi:hypothetical protein